MSRDTLYAWTAPGANYPAYINVATENDRIFVTVRSNAEGVSCGASAVAEISPLEAIALAQAILGEDHEDIHVRLSRLTDERRALIRAAGVEGRAESVEAHDAIEKITGWRKAFAAMREALSL